MITTYSQQNSQWVNEKLINGYTVGRWGCLAVSLANARNWFYNKNDNPMWTVPKLNYTSDGRILWNSLKNVGLKLVERVYGRNEAKINEALAHPNKCVILQVNNNHWVWAIGRKLPILGYRIADPWDGRIKYINFYRDNITGCAVISRIVG